MATTVHLPPGPRLPGAVVALAAISDLRGMMRRLGRRYGDGGTFDTADNKDSVRAQPGDYRKYYENVRDAILSKAQLAVTPQSALTVMRALELAQESSRSDRVLPWRA